MIRYLVIAASSIVLGIGAAETKAANIKVVNFKTCVEGSKLGKQEQASFDALKKQMETSLGEKEKVLNEMASKFEDADYLDSLSPEAETELKRKFRQLNQEYNTLQNQYYQTLNQTNMKIVQKLTDVVTKASESVAKQSNIDLILNDEACFFSAKPLDISSQIIVSMDQMFEKEENNSKNEATKDAKKSDDLKK